MNRLGAMAEAHWAEWLPDRYATIGDPEAFFEDLGQQAAAEIEALYGAMLTAEPMGLSPSESAGWRATAKVNAENQIVSEMLLIDPEPAEEETPADPAGDPVAALAEIHQSIYDEEPGATDPTS
jgi:hypothetical protein